MSTTRKNGAVIGYDVNGAAVSVRDFGDAFLSQVKFPELDAADGKAAAVLTLTLEAETVGRNAKVDGKAAAKLAGKAKAASASAFRIAIPGCESACSFVSKIDAITVSQKAAATTTGQDRIVQLEPTKLEVSDLVLTLAESKAQPFMDWAEDFVIKGINGAGNEKTAKIELLSADMKNVLYTLNLSGLGIHSLIVDKAAAGAEAVRNVKVMMYCEQVKIG